MSSETYNGYTNRETWAMALWLSNTEQYYHAAREVLAQEYEYKCLRDDALKDWVDDVLNPAHYANDRLTEELESWRDDFGSMWRVDWPEVVESLTDEE